MGKNKRASVFDKISSMDFASAVLGNVGVLVNTVFVSAVSAILAFGIILMVEIPS